MKNIIFIAPPAAGKGTMSKLLSDKYNYLHISTGDLLRKAKEKNDELGRQIESLLNSGKLLPDEIVYKVLDNCIKNIHNKPFILDGFPRNIDQVYYLEKLFKELNLNNYIVIYLDIDYDKAMARALGRLICPICNKNYNKYIETTKPKVENTCDICGSQLIIRNDDNEETFKIRYDTYVKETASILNYYKENNKLSNIIVNDNPQSMLKEIEKLLEV